MHNISFVKSIVAIRDAGVNSQRRSIVFVSASATIKIEEKDTEHGVRKDHRLEFRMAGLSKEADQTATAIRAAYQLEVVDVSGGVFLIGDNDTRRKTLFETHTGGRAGSFRGRAVTIDWSSI